MSGTFLKWAIPGVVTIGGGTALAVILTGATVSGDLAARATNALSDKAFAWAKVTIDGRDAVVTGTATTRQMIDDVTAKLAAVHGIRAVVPEVILAEYVSPFPFAASISGGAVTLDGGYPDDAAHRAILQASQGATDKTRLLSGGPAPALFSAAATWGLGALQQFDQGELKLADLNLELTGRARSAAAFDTLSTLKDKVPQGVMLTALTVTPPLVSPYIWSASYDGEAARVSGNAPDEGLAGQLRGVAPEVSTTLALASGEPAGFDANALVLLKNVMLLEAGKADIADGAITLSGAPPTKAIAEQVTAAITKIGGTVDLGPPRVAADAFGFTVVKGGASMAFAGTISDKKTEEKLAALAGADVSKLEIARGGPERFDSALDFGLNALGHLSAGEVAIDSKTISLKGRAASLADLKAVTAMTREGAPQGFTLARADLRPPVASPYLWSATKGDDGKVTLAGDVPSDDIRTALTVRIADLGEDKLDLADGAPDNFAASASGGLGVLALLDTGSVTFDGQHWAIAGSVDSAPKGLAADAAYAAAKLQAAGWTYDIKLPVAPALPVIDPYTWRAQKGSDGKLSFAGFVPTAEFKTYLETTGGAAAADASALGAGAPETFVADASAGLAALLDLDEGSLGLAGGTWTLTGQAASADTRTKVQDTLSARIDPAHWQITIQAADAGPVVTPYLWSADKTADGVALDGYLPSDTLRQAVATHAGSISRDSTAIASGEPAGFAEDALAGLDALSHLETGRASFDGSKWQLTGTVAAPGDGDLAVAALAKGSKAGALWDKAIETAVPAPPSASEEPIAASVEPVSSEAVPAASSAEPPSEPSAASEMSSSILEAPSSEEPPASVVSEPPAQPSVEPGSSEAPASSAEPLATVVAVTPPGPFLFDASRVRGGAIALNGEVPSAESATDLGDVAGKVPTDKLAVASDLPTDFADNAHAGIAALRQLESGRAGFDGKGWWLEGEAAGAPVRDTVVASLKALPSGALWTTDLTLLPPLDACQTKVAALAGRNAILFKAGSAILMDSSNAALDELSDDLQLCPSALVHVQGHTDADGAADINLALSVSRAEAVVNALIGRGIAVERLYAEGYGETEPVAPNDTKDGKQQNRRIAFEITEN